MRNLIVVLITYCLSTGCSNHSTPDIEKVHVVGNFSSYSGVDTTNIIQIERHIIDLDYDQNEDTLVLENLKDLIGDPQLYSIVKITLATKEQYILKNIGGYFIDKESKWNVENRIKSDKIYLPKLADKKCLLFIWDFQYPDCTSQFEIFQLKNDGIRNIFSDNFTIHNLNFQQKENHLLLERASNCNEDKEVKELKWE